MDDVLERDSEGQLQVRVVTANEKADAPYNYDEVFTVTDEGKRALRVVGAGGGGSGGGDVSSVNGKKGAVVLTGADINATLTGAGGSETATVTQHLQTLKNDDAEKGDAIQVIQELIPDTASTTNPLATKADITGGAGGLPEQTGHTGFLQTDGATASWSDNTPVTNNAIGSTLKNGGLAIGNGSSTVATSAAKGISLGVDASNGGGIAIGNTASSSGNDSIAIGAFSNAGPFNLAIGRGAYAPEGMESVVLSTMRNPDYEAPEEPGFVWASQKGKYLLFNTSGLIPSVRLAPNGSVGQVLSISESGMAWVDAKSGPAAIIREW